MELRSIRYNMLCTETIWSDANPDVYGLILCDVNEWIIICP